MSQRSKVKASKDKYQRQLPKTQGQGYIERNLMGVNPLSEQFEPTEVQPITQRQRMAGVS